MGHIFVSYSRSDKNLTKELVAKLEAAGYSIWLDREDIPPWTFQKKWTTNWRECTELTSCRTVRLDSPNC